MASLYRSIGMIYPVFVRKRIAKLLQYANIKVDFNKFNGFILLCTVLISMAIGFFGGAIFSVNFWPIFLVSIVALQISVYTWLLIAADRKGKEIEASLPDALQLMSSNLRAGFTTDKALILSARPEFGSLKDEIDTVGKEIATGREITESLKGISERVMSRNLDKTIELLISGIESGGELASLLDETAVDLRNQQLVDKKVRTSVNMYIIFIMVAAAIASPVLFGLSSYLVEVLTLTIANVSVPVDASSFNLPVNFGQVSVTLDFIIMFSILFLLSISISSSLILGMIRSGRPKDGAKYIPVIIVVSLCLFFFTRFVMNALLGHLFIH